MAINIPIYAQFNDKGLKDAEGAFEKFGNKVAGVAKAAAAAVATVGVAAAAGAVKAIDAGSDLAETQSKINVLFQDQADVILDWSKGMASSFGISEQAALDAAATFQVFGKAAGLSTAETVDFAAYLTELAADMASFNNATPEDTIYAIGAALRGESEPLRKYGVMLDDATLKAKAFELGIYDGNGALTQQQKILAAERAIYEQTRAAQGDFARTSDGLANKQRILKAQLENVTAQIGQKLLPVALTIASFFSNKLMPAIEAVANAFSKKGLGGVLDLVKSKLPAVKAQLGEWAKAFVDWIKVAGPKAIRALGDMIVQFARWMKSTGLPALGQKLQEWGKAFVDWIGPRIRPALNKLGELLAALGNWILDTGLPLLVDKLIQLGNALVDWIKPRIAPLLKELGALFVAIAQWVVTEGLPKLAELALKIGGALLGWVKDIAPEAIKGLASAVVTIVRALPGLFVDLIKAMGKLGADLGGALVEQLVNALKSLASKGLELGKSFANAIIGFINDQIIKRINDVLEFTIDPPGPGPTLTINPPDIPYIPKLATGGIVTSPTMALIGEAGPEAVIPLNKLGNMGGNTINITVTSANPDEVVRAIQQYARFNGNVPVATTTAVRR